MRLNLGTDYALRTLLYLGAAKRIVTIAEIANAYGISRNHLVKVSHNLTALKYVEATRGRTGGIRLARPPVEINLGQVVMAIEPTSSLVECFEPASNTCPISPVCSLKGVLEDAQVAFFEVLSKYTLEDLIGDQDSLRELLSIEAEPGTRIADRKT